MGAQEHWRGYQSQLVSTRKPSIRLDYSRMRVPEGWLASMGEPIAAALKAMDDLEAGAIANPDEQRMVGHYWLRDAGRAPDAALTQAIEQTRKQISEFASAVHGRQIVPPGARRFTDLLLIGIGGSALGPQLVADALGGKRDKLRFHSLDNTDPDGIARTLEQLGTALKSTLVLVISKSGGTPETRNGMLATQKAFADRKLAFAPQAVAVTGEGSHLDQVAEREGWLARFPMWDWVGGRTSVTSAVGLLPMALQGLDVDGFLKGAAAMDQATRDKDFRRNPAAMLALMWHLATDGRGTSDMVILPYKDRLVLFSRYLQQLVMESLGKAQDLHGRTVHQGIAVYGNKGSTDQHAYVQQLRDGLNNFFATFVVVLQDTASPRRNPDVQVEPGVTAGDYLSGFWQGTREALFANGRRSLTITCDQIDAATLGGLIALYERAVGLYAGLVGINAYHQPGVEAGKKAAAQVIELQKRVVAALQAQPDSAMDAVEMAQALGAAEQVETVHHILEHLAANDRGVRRRHSRYQWSA